MSDDLDDAVIEFNMSGLAVGVGTDSVELGLQSSVLSTELEEDALVADLVSDNLILRLYQPGGVPLPGDPWFPTGPGGGGLTQDQLDLITKAITDTAIAAAVAQAQITATSAANAALAAEVAARELADSIVTATVSDVSAALQTATDSTAISLHTVGARIDENVAALQDEEVARATAEDAIALRINQTVAVSAGNTAAINDEVIARTDGDTAIGKRIDVVVANVARNTSDIVTEQETRADAISAMATQLNAVQASSDGVSAQVTSLQTAQASNYAALVTSINTLTVTLNGHSTSIQTQQSVTDGLSAQYAIKIDNNGWISGYGLTSTPVNGIPVSEFAIRADKFSIWLPGYPGIAPFQVQLVDGVPRVSMVNAAIGDETVTNSKIANLAVTNGKIGNLEVDTFKLGNNSVTVPAYMSGSGGSGQVNAGDTTDIIASLIVSYPADTSVVVLFSWQSIVGDISTDSRIQVSMDGSFFIDVGNSSQQGFRSAFTTSARIYVSAGTHTFAFRCANQWNGGWWSIDQWSCLVLGVMK